MHYSVLKEEAIESLNIKSDGIYIDATVGYGGYSKEILKRLKKGYLFAFDTDPSAVKYSTEELSKIGENFKVIESNFKNLKQALNDEGVFLVDGIVFDLGVSSPQIDEATRGFSFMKDGPLDMRMSTKGLTAKDIIDNYTEEELTNIFYKYGEEKLSKAIAKKISEEKSLIYSTLDLVEVIKKAVGKKYFYKNHPERKIFQALRIEVNDELNILNKVLIDALELLDINGRLTVVSFHSLEDKIVKYTFNKYSEIDELVKGLPNIPDDYLPIIKWVNKSPVLPNKKELEENIRSKSAKLRTVERIKR